MCAISKQSDENSRISKVSDGRTDGRTDSNFEDLVSTEVENKSSVSKYQVLILEDINSF